MKNNNLSPTEQQKETLRIETFSDGVFCIAVTLLSIEIGVELHGTANNEGLLKALLRQWPICLAYVISFVNVLLAWIGHHGLFRMLRQTNNTVMISNGVLLMLVALVPFPTKTLGLYLQSGALRTAVVFYTGYFVLVSLAFRLLWFMICREPLLLTSAVTHEQVRRTSRNENTGLLFNSIIFAIAFISPVTALALSFIMWIYWILYAAD